MDPELTEAEPVTLNKIVEDVEKLNQQMKRFAESMAESSRIQTAYKAPSMDEKLEWIIERLAKMTPTPKSESGSELCVSGKTDMVSKGISETTEVDEGSSESELESKIDGFHLSPVKAEGSNEDDQVSDDLVLFSDSVLARAMTTPRPVTSYSIIDEPYMHGKLPTKVFLVDFALDLGLQMTEVVEEIDGYKFVVPAVVHSVSICSPSVCLNVDMDWFSYCAMRTNAICNRGYILSQKNKVRFDKPPAKPPDDIIIYAATEAGIETIWNKVRFANPVFVASSGVLYMDLYRCFSGVCQIDPMTISSYSDMLCHLKEGQNTLCERTIVALKLAPLNKPPPLPPEIERGYRGCSGQTPMISNRAYLLESELHASKDFGMIALDAFGIFLNSFCFNLRLGGDVKVTYSDTDGIYWPNQTILLDKRLSIESATVLDDIIYGRAYKYEHQVNLLLGLAAKVSEDFFGFLEFDFLIFLFNRSSEIFCQRSVIDVIILKRAFIKLKLEVVEAFQSFSVAEKISMSFLILEAFGNPKKVTSCSSSHSIGLCENFSGKDVEGVLRGFTEDVARKLGEAIFSRGSTQFIIVCGSPTNYFNIYHGEKGGRILCMKEDDQQSCCSHDLGAFYIRLGITEFYLDYLILQPTHIVADFEHKFSPPLSLMWRNYWRLCTEFYKWMLAPLVKDMASFTYLLDHAHFIMTNTYQEVAQMDDSHQGFTLTGPYCGIHGIDAFDTVFTIVSPGVDLTIYFSYNDDYKRLTTRHKSIEVVIGSSLSDGRLYWVKNLMILLFETASLNLGFSLSLDDHAILLRYITQFILFSLPRPPEIGALEDKVNFKAGGLLRIGILWNLMGVIAIDVINLV